jgi:heme-degrading monooxygenase HmoA
MLKKILVSLFLLQGACATKNVVHDQTNLAIEHTGKVVLINKFTAKPGQLDKFIEAQTNEYKRLLGKIEGWQGNRLIKSLDNKNAINIAVFDSMKSYNAWRNSKLFTEHVEVIKPFVEKSEPGMYEVLYDAGSL